MVSHPQGLERHLFGSLVWCPALQQEVEQMMVAITVKFKVSPKQCGLTPLWLLFYGVGWWPRGSQRDNSQNQSPWSVPSFCTWLPLPGWHWTSWWIQTRLEQMADLAHTSVDGPASTLSHLLNKKVWNQLCIFFSWQHVLWGEFLLYLGLHPSKSLAFLQENVTNHESSWGWGVTVGVRMCRAQVYSFILRSVTRAPDVFKSYTWGGS